MASQASGLINEARAEVVNLHDHPVRPGLDVGDDRPLVRRFLTGGTLRRRDWGEDSPWMGLFRNARVWVG